MTNIKVIISGGTKIYAEVRSRYKVDSKKVPVSKAKNTILKVLEVSNPNTEQMELDLPAEE